MWVREGTSGVEGRTGHRNGYKPRELRTRVGTLSLLVKGLLNVFAKYQRNEKALVLGWRRSAVPAR